MSGPAIMKYTHISQENQMSPSYFHNPSLIIFFVMVFTANQSSTDLVCIDGTKMQNEGADIITLVKLLC